MSGQHELKYLHDKKFFQSGISDKEEYAGWYIVAMQNAVYHLMSMYHARRGKKHIPHERMIDQEYFPENLKDLYRPYHILRNAKEATLYGTIAMTKDDVMFADKVFPEFERYCCADAAKTR